LKKVNLILLALFLCIIVVYGNGNEKEISSTNAINILEKVQPKIPKNITEVSSVDKLIIKWDKNIEPDFVGYSIFRKIDSQEEFKKCTITKQNEYEDVRVESENKYFYKISAFDVNGNESELSEEIVVNFKSSKYYPEGVCDIYPKKLHIGEKVNIYFSWKKSSTMRSTRKTEQSLRAVRLINRIFIKYGFNNWSYSLTEADKEPEMEYIKELEYYVYTIEIPENSKELNISFYDEDSDVDNNYSKNYNYKIESKSAK